MFNHRRINMRDIDRETSLEGLMREQFLMNKPNCRIDIVDRTYDETFSFAVAKTSAGLACSCYAQDTLDETASEMLNRNTTQPLANIIDFMRDNGVQSFSC